MKVINVPQPQATLLSAGLIKFVSGNWPDPEYRGPVHIRSSHFDEVTANHPLVRAELKRLGLTVEDLPLGSIVGEGKVQDQIDNNNFPLVPDQLEFACNHNIPGGESCLEVVETQGLVPFEIPDSPPGNFFDYELQRAPIEPPEPPSEQDAPPAPEEQEVPPAPEEVSVTPQEEVKKNPEKAEEAEKLTTEQAYSKASTAN